MNVNISPAPSARLNDLLRLGTTIPRIFLRDEAELIGLKWPAYRFQSPLALNASFRATYNEACKNRCPRNLSGPQANLGGISSKLNFWTQNSQLTQLHTARQYADRTGMPYDEYINFCFDFADRRKRDFLPRPNQLKPSEQAEASWFSLLAAYWTADRLWMRLATGPAMQQYDSELDSGLPAQTGFRKDLKFGKALGLSDLTCSVFVHMLCAIGIMLTLDIRRAECDPLYLACMYRQKLSLCSGDSRLAGSMSYGSWSGLEYVICPKAKCLFTVSQCDRRKSFIRGKSLLALLGYISWHFGLPKFTFRLA